MNREDMLAKLIAQAVGQMRDEGGGELLTLRAIVEESSELGARRVLDRLGLSDPRAQDDIEDLRELLGAWRSAKASAWKAAVEWLVRGLFALLLIGIAVRLNVPGLLK